MTTRNPFVFRAATPEDVTAIRDLVHAAYAKWVAVIGRPPLPMRADYARAVREHRFDLICQDGDIAGLIETMDRGDHIWIENVAVAPHRQGQGLGRRLLAHLEGVAFETGRSRICLLTNAAFQANVAFYERLGYGVDRREPFMGGTTIYMSKTLSAMDTTA